MLAGVLCRESHDQTIHGGDSHITYVVGMFAIYGLVKFMNQEGCCS